MPTYERTNARLSSPVNLRARFHKDGAFYDPFEIDRVEIWKFAANEADGGVMVDTVDGSNVIQDRTGHYRLLWQPCDWGSPMFSPNVGVVQGPCSPDAPCDPNDPNSIRYKITANTQYYDVWWYKPVIGYPEIDSYALRFYLWPDNYFVDSEFDKFRFELKPDRKLIVKGELLDIRLQIIPLPLFRSQTQPIIDYMLPISQMRVRVLDPQNNEVQPWTDITFTGREGILPTDTIASAQLGQYYIQTILVLPNGREIRYQKQSIQVID